MLPPHLAELQVSRCPFANLQECTEGRWGEGLTAAKMAVCRWLDPFLVARIDFLEWTPERRLRHPRFVEFRSDKDARDVIFEALKLSFLSLPRPAPAIGLSDRVFVVSLPP